MSRAPYLERRRFGGRHPGSGMPSEFYVTFEPDDTGGLGVRLWEIQRRVAGTTTWTR